MRRALVFAAAVGVLTVLLAYGGVGDVARAAMRIGWAGLAAMALVRILLLFPLAWAWQLLAPATADLWLFLRASWVRAAMGEMVVTPPLGSEAAALRILTLGGMRARDAAACTVVDLTLDLGAQVLFAVTGVSILSSSLSSSSLVPAVVAVAVAAAAVLGFARVQRGGLLQRLERRLVHFAEGPLAALYQGMQGLPARIDMIYRRRARLILSLLLQYAVWMLGVIPTGIGLSLLGHPLSWGNVIALDAIVFALRAAAFVMPAGIGVQEGAYVALAPLFGFDAATALALSLVRRAADVLATFPSLLLWQLDEGRRLRRLARPVGE